MSVDKRSGFYRYEFAILILITILALFLRLWRLDTVPPGWRDDELINSMVISQKVLDGDWALYYADASGHEALYHILNAGMLGLFGPGVAGMRGLSALLGTMTVPLTFLVGRRLFGSWAGLIAAAAMAVSFWSLMYSRIAIRHVLTPLLALAAFYFFLRGLDLPNLTDGSRKGLLNFVLAALAMGLGFYTYFASRGVPLIILAFCFYLLFFFREVLRRHLRNLLVMFFLTTVLVVPLAVTLATQPESEARVAELAVPLVAAREGDFEPLGDHLLITFSMFHADGDDEWLYNIPRRPQFSPWNALLFWIGLLAAVALALRPLYFSILIFWRRFSSGDEHRLEADNRTSPAGAFVILWFLAGISPAFVSVPPASLGHTILAQPAVFIILALPIAWVARYPARRAPLIAGIMTLVMLVSLGARDLSDYFVEWPARGMTRFLYRADIHDLSMYLNENPQLDDVGIASLLAGPWDKLAMDIDLDPDRKSTLKPRWYDPRRAYFLIPEYSFGGFPDVESPYENRFQPASGGPTAGSYQLNRVAHESPSTTEAQACFENGLCWVQAHFDEATNIVELEWLVAEPLQFPDVPLISNPPPPDVYSGPRLNVFAQIQDAQGQFLAGDDGLWVDPATLIPGDRFVQQHWLELPDDDLGEVLAIGLYDPMTGLRILTGDGRDQIRLPLEGLAR